MKKRNPSNPTTSRVSGGKPSLPDATAAEAAMISDIGKVFAKKMKQYIDCEK